MDQETERSTVKILDLPVISRVRRNHALEHATMRVLGERQQHLRLVGRSSPGGFTIYGSVSTERLLAAAREGLERLQRGQHQMAIHPNCGSNLAVAGILAGVGAFVALGGLSGQRSRRSFWERLSLLPLACTAAMLGVLLAQPLGSIVQARVTTQPAVGDLRIVSIDRQEWFGTPVHHVRTEG